MMLDGHDDQTVGLAADAVDLAEDSRDRLALRSMSPCPRAKLPVAPVIGEPVWKPHGGIPPTIGIGEQY